MSGGCPFVHIEEPRLETDLGYRAQYICKFVEFDAEDVKTMNALAPVLAPLVPTVVDAVYTKLFSFDVTKSVFLKRNEGFQGRLDADLAHLSQNSEQIKFRKDMLSKYLVRVVTGNYDTAMISYLDWVGKIHTDKAGAKTINVDYIHCGLLMGYVENVLLGAVLGAGLDAETTKRAVIAINKVLWIQNDLFVRHYLPTAEEKAILAHCRSNSSSSSSSCCPVSKSCCAFSMQNISALVGGIALGLGLAKAFSR
eukprot:ANDGO_07549.mRNA.1 hypothetical protein